jgi:hypothetical protein
MAEIGRDSVMGGEAPLAEGEAVLAEFRADAGAYWRAHARLALFGAVLAGVVLVVIGNPTPWVGPVAAVPAIFLRAWYLKSEALAHRWRLTPTRLLGPGLRVVPRSSVASVRVLLGDVLVVTKAGEKHLIKYPADPASVVATLERA